MSATQLCCEAVTDSHCLLCKLLTTVASAICFTCYTPNGVHHHPSALAQADQLLCMLRNKEQRQHAVCKNLHSAWPVVNMNNLFESQKAQDASIWYSMACNMACRMQQLLLQPMLEDGLQSSVSRLSPLPCYIRFQLPAMHQRSDETG